VNAEGRLLRRRDLKAEPGPGTSRETRARFARNG
jgi:hypothetical protein